MRCDRLCIIAWVLLIMLVDLQYVVLICPPEKCNCKNSSENPGSLRVKCGGTNENRLYALSELQFDDDMKNIVILDLSKNEISNVDKKGLGNLTALKRLDLSSNFLREIDKNTFGDGLLQLERLKLANNSIGHIYLGSFDYMVNLKQLDISNNPLVCDCDLIWMLAWSNSHLIKLQPAPKCEAPADFKGVFLKKLKVGLDLHCESPLQPLLELIPKRNQVVFEGDELILKCRAPRVAIGVPRESEDLPTRAHVFWGWSEKILHQNSTDDIIFKDPTKVFTNVYLETKHTTDSGILHSILKIANVTKSHTGMWDCTLRSQQANLSQFIAVYVISKNTQYCPAAQVQTNKGIYYWPQTPRGEIVRQECVEDSQAEVVASYHCQQNGVWNNLDTNSCSFVSETTRILEQFAKVNITLTKSNAMEIARRLHNFTLTTGHLRKIRDAMDLEFIARTLLKYLDYVKSENDIAYLLLDIVSHILVLPYKMFHEAQRLHNSGTKLLKAAEVAAAYVQMPPTMHQEPSHLPEMGSPKNLFIDYFNVRPDYFIGISCVWLRTEVAYTKQAFECSNSNESFPIFEGHIDAAIQIPIKLLSENSQKSTNTKLMVGIFRNANLLPYLNTSHTVVSSAIIGTKLISGDVEKTILDLNDKISVILRSHPYHNDLSAPEPAWWDSELNVWNMRVCQKLYMHRGLLMFSCSRLGYYGLLQKTEFLNDFPNEDGGAVFRFAPFAIYVGCAVLFVCSWINIVTFIVFGDAIRINRQQRYSFVNTWFALSLLCLVFTNGIYQTENYDICKVFGILIHYFSLCVLLWLCVSLSTMYKRLSKTHLGESELPKDVRLKKPILGIYLVGWGIGMIICGISSAVNINEYSSYSFCFLHNASALNAIVVPAIILLVFLVILFFCIYYHINQKVNILQRTQFSDNTQPTENIDMDWLDSIHSTAHRNQPKSNNLEQYRSLTLSNPLSSIVDDFECSNMAHLRAHFIFLLLFAISWLSAAAFVVHSETDESRSHMYSIVFAISSCFLGVFLLLFYTLSRNDIRREWRQRSYLNSSNLKVHNSVYNVNEPTTNNALAYKTAYDATNSGSRSNSQCSKNCPSSVRSMKSNKNERSSRNVDCQGQLGATARTSPTIINNQNTSGTFNSAMTREIPNADIFYNPNQINVARKFFRKQKRLAKRNNFELQRKMDRFDYVDSMSEVSSLQGSARYYSKHNNTVTLLSGGSKVKNTNIHYKPQFMVYGISKVSPSTVAVAGDHINADILANIYTNIPETASPQHEIIKLRMANRTCKPIQVETLTEHDEHEDDDSSREEHTPLYENTMHTNCFSGHTKNHLLSDYLNSTPLTEVLDTEQNSESKSFFLECNDMEAMNNLGLPELNSNTKINDRSRPDLQKDEIYISNSLQITNRIDIDENFSPVFIRYDQKQSKSLNNINDVYKEASHSSVNIDLRLQSMSNNDIPQTISRGFLNGEGDQSGLGVSYLDKVIPSVKYDSVELTEAIPTEGIIRTLSLSPTSESDLNYQNSEISIRSHGLYAPQTDNDINLTLTDDYPYHSANISDTDDIINDFDEEFTNFCAPINNNDLASHGTETHDDVNTSIDELYEAIKRRSPSAADQVGSTCPSRNLLATNSPHCNNFILSPTDLNLENSLTSCSIVKPSRENLNDTIEEDSSQSSVISYIDPNINRTQIS